MPKAVLAMLTGWYATPTEMFEQNGKLRKQIAKSPEGKVAWFDFLPHLNRTSENWTEDRGKKL